MRDPATGILACLAMFALFVMVPWGLDAFQRWMWPQDYEKEDTGMKPPPYGRGDQQG